MSIDPRSPCLIGTARRTWHPGDTTAPEPLTMWDQLARAAAGDGSARHHVLGAIDYLGLVHCQSWAYDHPVDRLADRLRISDAHHVESILAGTSPQRLLNDAAARMLRGDTSVALVVGGEALATRRQYDLNNEPPPWSYPHPSPPALPVDLDEWYLPTEIAHGVLPAWLTFALLEQARWAARGGKPGPRSDLNAVIAELNEVAGTNPDAWFSQSRTLDELTTAAIDNRMVTTPYTKRMTAFLNVDMAAANLLVTKEVADAWQVPDDQRVYLRGWGFARDAVHVAARAQLGSSPGMCTATTDALHAADIDVDDIDVFDLYSCFGSAVEFAGDALRLAADDLRPRSVTGGLPYHGGPSSNYMSHSIGHIVSRLRAGTAETALCTGIGMHMTKHVAAVWARTPDSIRHWHEPGTQQWGRPGSSDERHVVDHPDGTGTLAAATVVHDANGEPDHVIAICNLDDSARCYAKTADEAVMTAVLEDRWADQHVRIEPTDTGTNNIRLWSGDQYPDRAVSSVSTRAGTGTRPRSVTHLLEPTRQP